MQIWSTFPAEHFPLVLKTIMSFIQEQPEKRKLVPRSSWARVHVGNRWVTTAHAWPAPSGAFFTRTHSTSLPFLQVCPQGIFSTALSSCPKVHILPSRWRLTIPPNNFTKVFLSAPAQTNLSFLWIFNMSVLINIQNHNFGPGRSLDSHAVHLQNRKYSHSEHQWVSLCLTAGL